jgi:hypothetical protein
MQHPSILFMVIISVEIGLWYKTLTNYKNMCRLRRRRIRIIGDAEACS